jgi:hypothetical protein
MRNNDIFYWYVQFIQLDMASWFFVRFVPYLYSHYTLKCKGKSVPLHAMEALGGIGGIVPTLS